MGTRRGAFIVIEGTDGSGKGTQFELLKTRLSEAGYQVEAFDFPQYDQPSSYFVTQYLNGEYGSADEVGPYTASLFYALDRFEAAPRIRKALDEGKIVLSNRFTGSSMGHQGTKFRNPEERRGYFIWLDNLEFEMLRIPRPDVSFVLHLPAEEAYKRVGQKDTRTYTDKKRDIHEADLSHLQRAQAVYDDLTQLFPQDFQRIDCVRSGKLLDVESVQALLWEKVVPLLPQPPQLEMAMSIASPEVTAEAAPAQESEAASPPDTDAAPPAITKPAPTPAAPDPAIEPHAVTNTTKGVYAFTSRLHPAVVAAVIASLPHSSGALNTTVLEEFAAAAIKDQAILQNTVRTYHEDAGRLISQQVVITGASNMLAAELADCRGVVCISPHVRYIHYEQKDANGMYRYYMPPDLEGDLATDYRRHMDHIFDLYADMLPKFSSYLQNASGVPIQGRSNDWQAAMHAEAHETLKTVLPVAASATTAVYGTAQALQTLLVRMQSSPLTEVRTTGQHILAELRTVIPAFMEGADQPDSGGSEAAYRAGVHAALAALAAEHIPTTHAAETTLVQLSSVWPRNELELLPDMLYEHTGLPLKELQTETAAWPYSRKLSVFEAYIGERLHRQERPGRALEKVRYTWDIIAPFHVFCAFQRYHNVEGLLRQTLTPRYGYDVPESIEAADLSDQFEECFDTSLKLYSLLQQAGHAAAAQYATLFGHKQRWQVTHNARQAFSIYEHASAPHMEPAVKALAVQLHDKLTEIHPLIAEAMLFVGQNENPELDRLSIDRYNEFKQR